MAELDDRAQIFVGDVAEALADMEYSIARDPGRLAFAQRVMTEAIQRVIARSVPSISTAPAVTTPRQRKRRTHGSD